MGNKYWREKFLTNGDVPLYVLRLAHGKVSVLAPAGESMSLEADDLTSNNARLVLEELLVLREVGLEDRNRWAVNRKQ